MIQKVETPKIPKIRPLFDKIIVELHEKETTKGGIFLPDDVHIEVITATVLAKGEGAIVSGQIIPIPIEIGEVIVTAREHIETIVIDGEKIHAVRMPAVFGVLNRP